MKNKFLMILMMFIGVLFIVVSLVKTSDKCPDAKIVYRYVPRTYDEEQNEPVYPSDIFRTMFTQQSPWIRSIEGLDMKKRESMNNYFISQY